MKLQGLPTTHFLPVSVAPRVLGTQGSGREGKSSSHLIAQPAYIRSPVCDPLGAGPQKARTGPSSSLWNYTRQEQCGLWASARLPSGVWLTIIKEDTQGVTTH